ncbi:acyltransferase [Gammaproteobacteria bacterium]|nr:acyltransferase [Gammaproteobacteria bacterium]MDB9841954.1 acyltransferase [Gammaproteobacteria bacterium]
MKYRAEIDGLRALAVLPVILFHAGFELFSGGFVGVDVFFVISGYLITTIIISEMAEGKFSIVNFYERRARRILPALFFVMFACLPFAWMWLTPNDLKDFGQSLIAVSTFSSNILFWLESGYFDTAAELKPLLHTWSLAVEEQYYILFPIFLMFTWRLGIKWVVILLFIIFLFSLSLAQWVVDPHILDYFIGKNNLFGDLLQNAFDNPSTGFYLLPTRIWELLIGAFLSIYLLHKTHIKNISVNQVLSFCGLAMIGYSIFVFDDRTPFPSLFALLPTIGTGLVILCAVPETFVYKLLSQKLMVGCGLISYSAYLWHQPILSFARHRLFEISDSLVIIFCFISIILAWFSWYFVEMPFRNKKKLPRNKIFGGSIIGAFLFVLIGFSLHTTNGFEKRANFSKELYSSFEVKIPACREVIVTGLKKPLGCKLGVEKESFDFILFGDSHIPPLVSLVERLAVKNGLSILYSSKGGCLPFLDTYLQRKDRKTTSCYDVNKQIYKFAIEESVKGIILAARWALYTHGDYNFRGGYFVSNNKNGPFNLKDTLQENFYLGLDKTIEEYSSAKIPIHILTQPPHQKVEPDSAYFLISKGNTTIDSLSVARSEFDNLNELAMDAFVTRDHKMNIHNLTDIFCDSKLCKIGTLRKSFYNDQNHLSSYGANQLDSIFESILIQN